MNRALSNEECASSAANGRDRFFGIFRDESLRNELARLLGGASRKMVNSRLKEMESMGLLTRTVMNDRPIAVQLKSHIGRSALSVLEKLKNWAEENRI